ncbi:MAG: fructosamine kinase family protein [Ancrocorticia sp.]|uniref:fructosamine kinase family protein n=1 Tax=Ancrocorticia sp. TaxID=2593684 RepID=UPI003F93DB66
MNSGSQSFTKRGNAHAISAEAAGLAELGAAAMDGGAPVVRLLDAQKRELRTARLETAGPSASAAEQFGRALAATHAYSQSGHRVFGQCPQGLEESSNIGQAGRIIGAMGEAPLPLVAPGSPSRAWGQFFAEDRILPYLDDAQRNGAIGARGATIIERLCERLKDGEFDAPQPQLVHTEAALLHGDLWSGNIMWATAESAAHAAAGRGLSTSDSRTVGVLIDPACQGGHAESDLAQLTVFNAPFTDRIYAAYNEASPLAEGWRERIGLHTLHILIIHAAIFGGGYGSETVAAARQYL